jgi:molybdopterin biosynthesis enzyme
LRSEQYDQLLFGRVTAADVVDERGVVLVQKGDLLDKKTVDMLIEAGAMSVKVRSPLTCHVSS